MSAWRATSLRPSGFDHEALIYSSDDEFLAATVPFITDALDAAEPVLVVLPGDRGEMLRQTLGDLARHVRFQAMEEIGPNPACMIPAWREFTDERPNDGRPVRGIGDPVWGDRNSVELPECQLHESLLNEAFTDTPAFTLLCPYDMTTLDAATVQEARQTHPIVRQRGSRSASSVYAAEEARDRHLRAPLPEPSTNVTELAIRGPQLRRDLHQIRQMVAEHGAACGLDGVRVDNLLLAVDEIMVNAVRHGGGGGTLRVWHEGGRAVCEVRDRGTLNNAMIGRTHPSHSSNGETGLWLVNQLCDLVQIRSTPSGTVVRIHVGPDPPRRVTERDQLLLSLLGEHLTSVHRDVLHRQSAVPTLTPRQHELLNLVAAGASNTDIARRLYLSEATVRKHLENIYARLDVTSRTAAVARVYGASFDLT